MGRNTAPVRADDSASGLTKREHFAALAMQGELAADSMQHSYVGFKESQRAGDPAFAGKSLEELALLAVKAVAQSSVRMADALIEALNASPEEVGGQQDD